MQARVQEMKLSVAARPVPRPPDDGSINLTDLIKISGRASVRVVDWGGALQLKLGFVQTLTEFRMVATYGAGEATATYEAGIQAVPVRDSVTVAAKPWYTDDTRFSPLLNYPNGVANCEFDDEPSAPPLVLNHRDYGALQEIRYSIAFDTWLAIRDTAAGLNLGLVPLYEAGITARWHATNIIATAVGQPLTPVLTTLQSRPVTPFFLSTLAALWGARIANGPGLGQTWTVTVAMERLLADRVAEAARRAAEEAREAELLRAQNANLMTQTIQSAKEKMRKIKWDDD